ncbi:MAG: glycosyltransferase family A protein [Leeuwenhoekiella sp.]
MNSKVSIIIPTYNRAKKLIPCLESIFNQTYPNIEVILVDDGSTDNTCDIVQLYVDSIDRNSNYKYINQENQGAPAARNNGLYAASGELIVFFDSDDLMLSGRIAKQVQAIHKSTADSCACGFTNSISKKKFLPKIDSQKGVLGSLLYWNLMGSTQSWMYRKEYLIAIKGYDPCLKCYQDWDLTFRYLSKYKSVALVQESLSIFSDEDNNDRITSKISSLERLPNIQRYYLKVLRHLITIDGSSKLIKHITLLYLNQITLIYKKSGENKLAWRSYGLYKNAVSEGHLKLKIQMNILFGLHFLRNI